MVDGWKNQTKALDCRQRQGLFILFQLSTSLLCVFQWWYGHTKSSISSWDSGGCVCMRLGCMHAILCTQLRDDEIFSPFFLAFHNHVQSSFMLVIISSGKIENNIMERMKYSSAAYVCAYTIVHKLPITHSSSHHHHHFFFVCYEASTHIFP